MAGAGAIGVGAAEGAAGLNAGVAITAAGAEVLMLLSTGYALKPTSPQLLATGAQQVAMAPV